MRKSCLRKKNRLLVTPTHLYIILGTFLGVIILLALVQSVRNNRFTAVSHPDQAAAAPNQVLPRLQTSGNKIVISTTGQEIRLRGVNVCSLEFDNSGRNYELSNGQSNLLTVLSDRSKWNANSFRMPLNQEWFVNNTNNYVSRVTQIIDDANNKGLYVIADDQWEKGQSTDPYSLNILKIPTFGSGNTTEAFWRKFISLYKDRTNIIYDVINEPHDYPASESAAAMQRMVTIMRSLQPNALIMVGGYSWAHSVDYYRTNPISGENIIYSAHQYLPYDNPDKFQSNFGATAKVRPTYLGEFDMDSDYINGQPYQKLLIDYAESNELVGWAPWAIGCGFEKDSYSSYGPAKIAADYMRRLNVRPGLTPNVSVTPAPVYSATPNPSVSATPILSGGNFSGVTEGQRMSGKIYVGYTAKNSLARMQFYVDSSYVNSESTAPYYLGGNSGTTIYGYDVSGLSNGYHRIYARGYDSSGRQIEEGVVGFYKGLAVTPSPTPLPSPANLVSSDSRVRFVEYKPYTNGKVYIRTDVSGVTVSRIEYYVDETKKNSEYTAPYFLGGDSSGNPYGYATTDYKIAIRARVYTSSGSYFDAKTNYAR